jgi:hypothetical protein
MRQMAISACRRTLAYFAGGRRARSPRSPRHTLHLRAPTDAKKLAVFASLPLRERVTDRLGDALLATDESLVMCEMEAEAAHDSRHVNGDTR